MKEYNNGLLNYVNTLSIEDLRIQHQGLIQDAHSSEDICGMFEVLIDRLEEATAQRDQALAALKQAKKTLKKAIIAFAPKEVHKPEDCRYYTDHCFFGCNGGCLGTKEIDPCEGENCPRWKPKEKNK